MPWIWNSIIRKYIIFYDSKIYMNEKKRDSREAVWFVFNRGFLLIRFAISDYPCLLVNYLWNIFNSTVSLFMFKGK